MKKDILILAAAVFFLGTAILRSQSAAPVAKPPMEMLQGFKASNAALIEQQKKTLDALDEMQKAADQIKILGKRA